MFVKFFDLQEKIDTVCYFAHLYQASRAIHQTQNPAVLLALRPPA